jgi:NAD(P)-dependent dehydrogenase (short-subunit alcohol dehydrogenase family)
VSKRLNRHQRLLSHYGTWAVVTGASSGIGWEMATQLAQAGLNLVDDGETRLSQVQLQQILDYVQCGFVDRSHLHRHFRKYLGVTPRADCER